jgi:hypothetical protein
MNSHDDNPVTLTAVRTEQEAAIIVASLADNGIKARAVGDLTAGFRAEAPGSVQVLVRSSDLPQARVVLEADASASMRQLDVPDVLQEARLEVGSTAFDTWREVVRILVLLGLTVTAALLIYALISTFGRE